MNMPCNLATEMALLGNIMVDHNSAYTVFQSDLKLEDFYDPNNQIIFKTIRDLYQMHKACENNLVIDALTNSNQLNKIGGVEYIYKCCDSGISGFNTETYIEQLQEKRQLRDLITLCQDQIKEASSGNFDVPDFLSQCESKVLDITRNRKSGEFQSSKSVLDEVINDISKMSEMKSSIVGVPCKYNDIDRVIHGFQKGTLVILAARPSMGKTALAVDMAVNMAMDHRKVAFFSLEMGAKELMTRILSYKSNVKGDNLKIGKLTSSEWNQISEATSAIKNCGLYFDDTPLMTVNDIAVKSRKLKNDEGLDAIYIDYIQLIHGNGKYNDNRQQEVSDISRNLKALARELGVPVIALSQLSRVVESRENKRPMMSDLRESGAIEQDADIIMLIYRDSYYNQEAREAKEKNNGNETVEVNIAKHRNGATRNVELAFNGDYSGFYNLKHENVVNNG